MRPHGASTSTAPIAARRRLWLAASVALPVLVLSSPASVCAQSVDAFFVAVQRDDVSGLLLQDLRGVNLNSLNAKGQHALHVALGVPALKAADYLARHPGVEVDLRNRQDETPLMLALLKGHMGIVRVLIERGADVYKTGWTPLHYAAAYPGKGAVEQVQLLLEHHAYIDAESPNKTTPLMMAARYGSADVVKLLLEQGADASLRNELNLGAIEFAQQAARPTVAELIAAHARGSAPAGKW